MRSKLFLKCLKKNSRAVFEFLPRTITFEYLKIVFVQLFILVTSSDRLCYDLRSLRIFARSLCVTNASRACGQR